MFRLAEHAPGMKDRQLKYYLRSLILTQCSNTSNRARILGRS